MEAMNTAIVHEDTHIASKEELVPTVDKETVENLMDHYDEPSCFFRGAVFGFILCIPFWAAIFWFIA